MTDLKPCPFCGSTDIWPEAIRNPYGMTCGNCGASGPPSSYVVPDEAIEAWNNRYGLLPLEQAPKGPIIIAAERPPYEERTFYYDVVWDEGLGDFVTTDIRALNGATHYIDPAMMPTLPPQEDDTPVCTDCEEFMVEGQALASTIAPGTPDFPGDTSAITMSAGGPGVMIDCWKCPECGKSVTKEAETSIRGQKSYEA